MASVSQTVGEITITGSNSVAGGPVTFTLSSSTGAISGLSASDIQNATYAPDPNDTTKTIATFGGRAVAMSNAKASSLQSGASSAVSSITQQLTAAPGTPPTNTATANPAPAPAETAAAAGRSTNSLVGSANGDSGAPQAAAPGTIPNSPAGPAGAGGTTASTATNNASTPPPSRPQGNSSARLPPSPTGYQYQASSVSTQQVASVTQPGKRLKNPLGEFSTYTYQLSLYMITPDAYEAFVASGRTKIDAFNTMTAGTGAGGAFLIAQSGGINNTTSKRMPGFEFDYGIDNLQITQAINTKSTQDSNMSKYLFSFQITEPYGFSFVTNIRDANATISEYMGGINSVPENGAKQFFILGIRFFGYNVQGVPAKPTDTMSYNGNEAGQPNMTGAIDPLSQSGEIFETFYDLTITSIKFKLDGKMTVYSIEALNSGQQAGFSIKRGMINYDTPIIGTSVAEIIDKLMVKLNTEQVTLSDQRRIKSPNQYEVVWMPGTQSIIDATILSPADMDKAKSPGSGATSTQGVNVATETQNQAASNGVRQIMNFNHDTSILAAINQVIAQSSYLEDALKVVYTTALETPAASKSPDEVDNTQQKRVSWYSCTAQIKKITWDDIVNDWAYTIAYIIQKYETPVVDSSLVKSGQYYPGPHKRYDYWYTGKNSEILHYEQTFDNLFFNVALNPSEANSDGTGGSSQSAAGQTNTSSGNNTASNPTNTAIVPGKFTSQPRIGKTGLGMEAQNNYTTSLYDPGAFAEASISILGDPDYLMQEPTFSESVIYDSVYGANGYSVNPGGGQVFIEIDFKEAVDYTSQTGTLSINDSIQFWKYPENISSKIKGVSYMLTECVSKFRNGSFTQDLKAVINAFSDPGIGNPAAADSGRSILQSIDQGTENLIKRAKALGLELDRAFNAYRDGPSTDTNNTNETSPVPET